MGHFITAVLSLPFLACVVDDECLQPCVTISLISLSCNSSRTAQLYAHGV